MVVVIIPQNANVFATTTPLAGAVVVAGLVLSVLNIIGYQSFSLVLMDLYYDSSIW